MKINWLRTFLWTVLFGGAFASPAGVTTWRGVSVDYGNASANTVDGDLVLTYTSTSVNGLLSLDRPVTADILAVGGGGGGGGGYSSGGSSYYGNGGDGGAVLEKKDQLILAGSLTVKIGSGGAGSNDTGASNYGGDGQPSSVSGTSLSSPITAEGGAGGRCRQSNGAKKPGTGASGSGTMGKVSEITGNAYGAGGAAGDGTTAGSATANTGNGGKGGRNSSNSTSRKGGNGGSGIVVVRLKDAYALADVTLTSLSLAQSEMVSSFADASTGSAVEIRYGQVGEMSFSVANVARAERTKDGAFAIVGMQPGTTRATFGVMDAEAKVLTAYTVDITVSASVDLQDVSLQRGETVTAFRRKDTGAAISFDAADVKVLLSSVSEIAELVRLPDGRVGVMASWGARRT